MFPTLLLFYMKTFQPRIVYLKCHCRIKETNIVIQLDLCFIISRRQPSSQHWVGQDLTHVIITALYYINITRKHKDLAQGAQWQRIQLMCRGPTLMKINALESPTLYFPSDTLIMGNWAGQEQRPRISRTWGKHKHDTHTHQRGTSLCPLPLLRNSGPVTSCLVTYL